MISADDDVQCDQMDRLFAKYLAIYNDEHLPNCIKVVQSWLKNHSNAKFAKDLIFLPKSWSFAKSGRTDSSN